MINYDDNNKGQPMAFTNSSAQTTVESNNRNQSSGASQWGYASPRNNWAGYTNIANDFGTDPRSVEYMAWNYTIANTFYHNYLYRVDLDVPPPPGVVYSFSDQQLHAMTLLAMALEAYNEPVGVPINGGQHIVGVTGVWSGNDPATNYPAQIQGLVYRDPEGDVNSSRQEIDYSVWASGNYGNPFGTYSLWSLYYGDLNHVGDSQNTTDDPEPIVGPYAPHRFFPYHWYHGFNWIRLDNNYSNGQWALDWAYNAESGAKMTTP